MQVQVFQNHSWSVFIVVARSSGTTNEKTSLSFRSWIVNLEITLSVLERSGYREVTTPHTNLIEPSHGTRPSYGKSTLNTSHRILWWTNPLALVEFVQD